jgi:hypothetical protein
MSIFKSIVAAGLLCSAAVYAADIDLTAPAFIDDFNDETPNQCAIGALYGFLNFDGMSSSGGGYWYFFQDTKGSTVTNSLGEQIAKGDESSMVPDSTLFVNLTTSTVPALDYPFAGVGCNLAGGTETSPSEYLDLSKMTAVSLKVKGTGSVRMHFETKDIADSAGITGWDWGYYGKTITLTADWTTVTIPIDSLKPEQYSKPFDAKMTWATGKTAVNKIAFQAKNGIDAVLHVDDIKLVGMTYGDIKFPAVRVISYKAVKGSNIFNVNASSISFKLAQAQDLTVSLNDVMGNKISSLYTGKTASGTINLSDKNLASGRYLVVVSGKNVNYSQPIVIMK